VVVVFASLHDAREAATNARPYGIALLLVVASVLQLVRWLDQRRLRNLIGFILTAATIPYFHYLFATVYLVFLRYAVYIWRSDRRLRIRDLMAAGRADRDSTVSAGVERDVRASHFLGVFLGG
jgi:uncharacterized membrane protein